MIAGTKLVPAGRFFVTAGTGYVSGVASSARAVDWFVRTVTNEPPPPGMLVVALTKVAPTPT